MKIVTNGFIQEYGGCLIGARVMGLLTEEGLDLDGLVLKGRDGQMYQVFLQREYYEDFASLKIIHPPPEKSEGE